MKRFWILAAATLLVVGTGCTKHPAKTLETVVEPPVEEITGVQKDSGTATDDVEEIFLGDAARVAPASREEDRPAPASPSLLALQARLGDIHFDFDRAVVRDRDKSVLLADARVLKANPGLVVSVEGHSDERGTTAYNLSLGERRAVAARRYLIALGVSPAQLRTVSMGEERPLCSESGEACWSQNRRAHFALGR